MSYRIEVVGSEVCVTVRDPQDRFASTMETYFHPEAADEFALEVANAAAEARQNADRARVPTADEVKKGTS